MNTISERIIFIRQNACGKKLSQDEFGKSLGMSRSEIANIEDAENRLSNGISDSTLRLICATYNVNYQWLTEGKEPIFFEDEGDELIRKYAPFAKEHLKTAIRTASTFSDSQWAALRDFINDMVNAVDRMRADNKKNES